MAAKQPLLPLEQFLLPNVIATGKVFNRGTFGEIIEMKLYGAPVAGKRMYDIFSYNTAASATNMKHFEETCAQLTHICHPNIVQFLGLYYQLEVTIPLVVTELLPFSLTQCLEKHGPILTDVTKLNILVDIAHGLLYLHNFDPPIIHGCLTADSVLLTQYLRAKIDDVMMTSLFHPLTFSNMGHKVMSYISPEAQIDSFEVTNKTDVFSFDNLILHIVTHQWPLSSPPFESDTHRTLTEIERRQHYLEKAVSNNSLCTLAKKCLGNFPEDRPCTTELVETLEYEFSQSVNQSSKEHLQTGSISEMHESILDLVSCYEKRIQQLRKERDELLAQSLKTLTDVKMKSKSYLTEQEVEVVPTVMSSNKISSEDSLLILNSEKDDKLIERETKVLLDYEFSEPDLAEPTDKNQTNELHGIDVDSSSHKHIGHSTSSNIINQVSPQESDSTNVLTAEESSITLSIKMLQPMDGIQLLDLPDGQIENEKEFPPPDYVCIEPDLAEDKNKIDSHADISGTKADDTVDGHSSQIISNAINNNIQTLKRRPTNDTKQQPNTQSNDLLHFDALTGDITMKVVVLGGIVGKTCYCIRVTENYFFAGMKATIGADVWIYKTIRQQCTVRVIMWDIAMPNYHPDESLLPFYVQGTNGVIVICNITRKNTLLKAKELKKGFDNHINAIPSLLLVNQIDLPSEHHELTYTDIDEVVKECNFDAVFKISCKENINCNESIESLIDLILQRSIKPSQSPSNTIEPVTNKQSCFLM